MADLVAVAVVAGGEDAHVVVGVGCEAGDGAVVDGAHGDGVPGGGGGFLVLDDGAEVVGADGGPGECSRGGAGLNEQVFNGAAVGDFVECDVVDIGVPDAGRQYGADGDMGAADGVWQAVEVDGVAVPVGGGVVDEDGVVGGEGVDVVGVVHDADVEDGFVGGGGRFSPEGEHQVVGGVDGGVDRREDDDLVGAVGACGGGAVPVETLFTARGVVVGGAVAHIDIGVCGGVGVEVPAGDEVEGVVGTDGYILEVLEVGEGVEVAAFAVGGEAGWGAGVVGRADGAYFEVVEGVGSHAGDE